MYVYIYRCLHTVYIYTRIYALYIYIYTHSLSLSIYICITLYIHYLNRLHIYIYTRTLDVPTHTQAHTLTLSLYLSISTHTFCKYYGLYMFICTHAHTHTCIGSWSGHRSLPMIDSGVPWFKMPRAFLGSICGEKTTRRPGKSSWEVTAAMLWNDT